MLVVGSHIFSWGIRMSFFHFKPQNKIVLGPVAGTLIVLSWLLIPFKILQLANDPAYGSLYNAFLITNLLGMMGVILGLMLAMFSPSVEARNWGARGELTSGLGYGALFLALFFILNLIMLSTAEQFLGATNLSRGDRILLSYNAAINEELFFRFAIQQFLIWILPADPMMWFVAVFFAAGLFSLFHIRVYGSYGLAPFLYLFFLGFMAGTSMLVSGYLLAAFTVHGGNNALALLTELGVL